MELMDNLLTIGCVLIVIAGLFGLAEALDSWRVRRKAKRESLYFQRAKWPDED